MIRSFRYPLHPTIAQETVLLAYLAACCSLYNAALQERRDAWKWRKDQALARGLVTLPKGKSRKAKPKAGAEPGEAPKKPEKPKSIWVTAINKAAKKVKGAEVNLATQQSALTEMRATMPDMADVPCEVARSALHRVDRAFDAFFHRCGRGEKPGYPRFKPKQRYDSFNLGGNASRSHVRGTLIRDGRVAIPLLGYVKFHQYRPLHGRVLDVIVRREVGKWFVVFQCDVGAAPVKVDLATVPDERVIGVDVGLAALATLSTGETIPNPRHGRAAAKKLAARQRCLARKTKGSRSRRRAVIQVARAHADIRNQRKDTAFKAATDVCARFDVICFEDLSVARMVHGNLAFSIHDAGWRILINAASCKAESAGKHTVQVDARGTSKDCSRCGFPVEKDLSVRTHRCPHCGLVLDRDHNAARNIKARGRRVLGLHPPPGVTGDGQHRQSEATDQG